MKRPSGCGNCHQHNTGGASYLFRSPRASQEKVGATRRLQWYYTHYHYSPESRTLRDVPPRDLAGWRCRRRRRPASINMPSSVRQVQRCAAAARTRRPRGWPLAQSPALCMDGSYLPSPPWRHYLHHAGRAPKPPGGPSPTQGASLVQPVVGGYHASARGAPPLWMSNRQQRRVVLPARQDRTWCWSLSGRNQASWKRGISRRVASCMRPQQDGCQQTDVHAGAHVDRWGGGDSRFNGPTIHLTTFPIVL